MSLPTCGKGYTAALYTFVSLRCRRQKRSAKTIAISIIPPRMAPTMTAVGTRLPPDCGELGDSVLPTPVVKLARADVEIIESGVVEDAAITEELVEVELNVIERVRTVVVVDAFHSDTDPN